MGAMSQDMLGVRLPSVFEVRVQWAGLASAAVTAFGTMLAGALWPAIRASRLKPVDATRYV